jgi:hypothetical protein
VKSVTSTLKWKDFKLLTKLIVILVATLLGVEVATTLARFLLASL